MNEVHGSELGEYTTDFDDDNDDDELQGEPDVDVEQAFASYSISKIINQVHSPAHDLLSEDHPRLPSIWYRTKRSCFPLVQLKLNH
jgi:hypothetical protein